MKRIAALPKEIGTFIDETVLKQSRGSDETAMAEARARLVVELISDFEMALSEVVEDLRRCGLTWRDTAAILGMTTASAAERRFSKTLSGRREKSKQAQVLKTPVGLLGDTIAMAAQKTGLSPSTVSNRITANLDNPNATWFARTPANNKRGYVNRILDLEGLKSATVSVNTALTP